MTPSDPRVTSDADGDTQRRDLADAERAASARQPGSFKDEATTKKIVQVDEIGKDDAAIKGIDPA